MLLAKQNPVSGFRKRLPVVAAGAPNPRGFGPRRKVVAVARKSAPLAMLRPGGAPADAMTPALGDDGIVPPQSDEDSGVEWVNNIDWGGTPLASGDEPQLPANGHGAVGDFVAGLPPPAALPPVAPH